MQAKLIVLEGKNKDRVIPLPETIFLIGRDPQCHLRPHCEGVSKLHCAIAAWSGKVRVRDLKSKNGTFLNGQQIRGEVGAVDGDQLRIGTLVFALRIVPVAADASATGNDEQHSLQWLLTANSDSNVLSPTSITRIISAAELAAEEARAANAADTASLHGATEQPLGSKAVSAGQHLHAYYESRKRNVPPETKNRD